MKIFLKLMISMILIVPLACLASNFKSVLVSFDLVSLSQYSLDKEIVIDSSNDDTGLDVKFNDPDDLNKQRVIVDAITGYPATLSIIAHKYNYEDVCTVSVLVSDDLRADIQVFNNTNPRTISKLKCEVSGDVNANTAVIKISNKGVA